MPGKPKPPNAEKPVALKTPLALTKGNEVQEPKSTQQPDPVATALLIANAIWFAVNGTAKGSR
jgi:hypothetical protein